MDLKLKSELQSQDKGAWEPLDQSKLSFLMANVCFSCCITCGFKEQSAKVVDCFCSFLLRQCISSTRLSDKPKYHTIPYHTIVWSSWESMGKSLCLPFGFLCNTRNRTCPCETAFTVQKQTKSVSMSSRHAPKSVHLGACTLSVCCTNLKRQRR